MRKRKVVVIANAKAGAAHPHRRRRLAETLGSMLSGEPRVYNTRSLEEMDRVSKEIRSFRPDVCILQGGDGTAQGTLTSLIREWQNQPSATFPLIYINPCGTMNVVARSMLRTGDSFEDQAGRIMEKLERNLSFNTALCHPLKITSDSGVERYGFIYGAGLPVNFLQKYYEVSAEERGPARAVEVILSTLWDELLALLPLRKPRNKISTPIKARVSIPGHEPCEVQNAEHTALLAAAVDQVGLGFRAMPLAMRHPGRFMLRSTSMNFWGFIRHLLALRKGRPLSSVFDAVVGQVAVKYDQPSVRMIDGEILPAASEDVIECGPALTFITG